MSIERKLIIKLSALSASLFLVGCSLEDTPENFQQDDQLIVAQDDEVIESNDGQTNTSNIPSIIIVKGRSYLSSEYPITIQATSEECQSVVFNIVGEGARFSDGGTSTTVNNCDQAIIPDIVSAEQVDIESTISASDNAGNQLATVRVATVGEGSMNSIASTWPSESYTIGNGYALVDESYSKEIHSDTGVRMVVDDDTGGLIQERGICVRKAWGPGRAEWQMNDPWRHGHRYIKEQDDNRMFWPGGNATVKRDVDAICRTTWARDHSAIKIPDSCTVTTNANHGRSYCCNSAMKALGHTAKWVYTGNGNKPWWAKEKIAAWHSCN